MVATGDVVTVPETATFRVVPPVEAQVILPDGDPAALDFIRTNILVSVTAPPVCVRVRLLLYEPPTDVASSKPVGAVIMILAVRFAPLTVKLCVAEAVPEHVVNPLSVPVVAIDGGPALVNVNGTIYVQAPPTGVILAYNFCEPTGRPEGVNVLGAVKVPAEVVAVESVKMPLIVPSNGRP